jgi:hypothetical protein
MLYLFLGVPIHSTKLRTDELQGFSLFFRFYELSVTPLLVKEQREMFML